MISHVRDLDRTQQVVQKDLVLNDAEIATLDELLAGRQKRIPIQYLTGQAHFMGLKLKIEAGVFIPRTDTESLVEIVVDKLKEACREEDEMLLVLELGVGSGAISIALLRRLPNLQIVAIDLSNKALQVTRDNAARHAVLDRLSLFREEKWWTLSSKFRALVSNPPYIPKAQKDSLEPEVGLHEPASALFGEDEDGLGFYRLIAEHAGGVLAPGALIAVEVGDGQALSVSEIFAAGGFENPQSHKDVNGLERVVTAYQRQGADF
jgi:release factor glutamine methyltransferase